MAPLDERKGIWKSGKGKGRSHTKGRPLEDSALADVQALLGDLPRRRDLLIEHLHLIQDRYNALSAAHLRALAEEMRMAQAEKKAAALPAQLTVPMILFFLPVLFLVVLGPAYIGFKASQASDEASVPSIEQSDTNWG